MKTIGAVGNALSSNSLKKIAAMKRNLKAYLSSGARVLVRRAQAQKHNKHTKLSNRRSFTQRPTSAPIHSYTSTGAHTHAAAYSRIASTQRHWVGGSQGV